MVSTSWAMPQINGLPDLSRFVRRENTLHIHNTVQLIVGETSVEVNGYIISQKSQKLEDLVTANGEIYMDQFVVIRQLFMTPCIELLYWSDLACQFNATGLRPARVTFTFEPSDRPGNANGLSLTSDLVTFMFFKTLFKGKIFAVRRVREGLIRF